MIPSTLNPQAANPQAPNSKDKPASGNDDAKGSATNPAPGQMGEGGWAGQQPGGGGGDALAPLSAFTANFDARSPYLVRCGN